MRMTTVTAQVTVTVRAKIELGHPLEVEEAKIRAWVQRGLAQVTNGDRDDEGLTDNWKIAVGVTDGT